MTRVTPNEVLYPLHDALRRETKARLDDTGVSVHDIGPVDGSGARRRPFPAVLEAAPTWAPIMRSAS
jgi:hypothetical protein